MGAAARSTVRVGVVGHRTEALVAGGWDEPRLREAIRRILALVRQEAESVWRENRNAYDNEARPRLCLVSALAEGSDRVVAAEALGCGFELQCVFPFPREEYERDFTTAESKECFRGLLERASAILELDGNARRRPEAYEAAGRMVLRQCDILLAIWDGGGPLGVGGTAQMVSEALLLAVPVVWIRAQTPHAACLWETGAHEAEPGREVNLDHLAARLLKILKPSTALGT
jgi:hypothetical protein